VTPLGQLIDGTRDKGLIPAFFDVQKDQFVAGLNTLKVMAGQPVKGPLTAQGAFIQDLSTKGPGQALKDSFIGQCQATQNTFRSVAGQPPVTSPRLADDIFPGP
jgi:hypothetical protein